MTTTLHPDKTVGEMVTERPARSRVFEKLGIDYCCGGKLALKEACQKKGLDPETVRAMLEAMETMGAEADAIQPDEMSDGELIDHILETHHAYLRRELRRLEHHVCKVNAVHGKSYAWLAELEVVFLGLEAELKSHMMKEEQILFPVIRNLEAGEAVPPMMVQHLNEPVEQMEREHAAAGQALERMSELTHGYQAPEGACNTFRAMLDGLRELEADMHQHIHLENNVLFPRALRRVGRE